MDRVPSHPHPTDSLLAPSFHVVGETAVSQIAYDPYDHEYNAEDPAHNNITRKSLHLHGERGNRRIRELPCGVQPRQQLMVDGGCVPPAHSAGVFGNALMSHARNSYSHAEGTLPAGSNVSLLSDASAFADGEHLQLTRDSIRRYDLSLDCLENPFLSHRIGTPRHAWVPSDHRRGVVDALSRDFGPPGLSIGTDLGAYGMEPSSSNGVLLRLVLQEGSDLPGDHYFASRRCDLSDAASAAEEVSELISPVQNIEVGGSTAPADRIRQLVAAKSGLAKKDPSKDVGRSGLALPTHSRVEQRDRKKNGSNYLTENEDSAPYYIIYVGGKESASAQIEGDSSGDEVTPKRAPPIRFFDAGVEISMYGRPLSRKRKRGTPSRSFRSPRHDKDQANFEGEEALRNLQEHQRSIWDQFVPKTQKDQAALPSETPIQCEQREHQGRHPDTSVG